MKRATVLGAALVFGAAAPLAAQATIGWDAALFSSYVWRGVTYTNKPVVQPDLWVSFPVGTASITVGGWGNVDIGKYDDPLHDRAESGGTSAFNFAEFDYWAEIGIPAGVATITGGVTGYFFPNDLPGYTSAYNTTELYAKVGLSTPLSPKLSAYYDVDAVKGLYIEGSVTHGIPLGATTLNLGGLVGWNNGQSPSLKNFSYNFADDGFTHVDLSAALPFTAGPLSISPSVHGVIGIDKLTKVLSASSTNTGFKVWGGVTLSWSHGLGAPKEEASE